MLIINVDFDGTLTIENSIDISKSIPNFELINKLINLKNNTEVYIRIVTARGSKNKLSNQEKIEKYSKQIKDFCYRYSIPYDEISYNKDYAHIYIDDMTINQHDDFFGFKSIFRKNNIIITPKTVVKNCTTAQIEKRWYDIVREKNIIYIPEVLFCNDELIITSRIQSTSNINSGDIIDLLEIFKNNEIINYSFDSYLSNICIPTYASNKIKYIINSLPIHSPTFFHGDLSSSNIIKNNKLFLIDPNYKNIFGSYLTDAGKAYFSFIAYDHNFKEADKIAKKYGKDVIKFAVAEGCRVCKYSPNYVSIVNNIGDLL
jgi:hypothetical protein